MRYLIYFISILVSLLPLNLAAQGVIHSSVSPEFLSGLHSKYLRYLAKEMDMELKLSPMSFQRRIEALRKGDIDIMVGLQRRSDEQDEFLYLYPSYETLRHTFFVLKEKRDELVKFEDLKNLNIGVTIHAKYYDRFNKQKDLALVGVSSLKQKLQLLLKGRIDTFIHFKESTLPTLDKMQLTDKVVEARYQPPEHNAYFFALSSNSALLPIREKFEEVIARGLESGDFAQIRATHYAKPATVSSR